MSANGEANETNVLDSIAENGSPENNYEQLLKLVNDDGEQEQLVNEVGKKLSNLDENKKDTLKGICENFFSNGDNLDIIKGKEPDQNTNFYNYKEKAEENKSAVWAVGYLLTALAKGNTNPTRRDVYDYFKDFEAVDTAIDTTGGNTETENTETENTETENTETENTETENTETENTETENTETENTDPESTETESTETENTDPESTETESTETENTDPESTETENTETENTETENTTEKNEILPETFDKRRQVITDLGLKPVGGNKIYEKDTDRTKTNFEEWESNPPQVYERVTNNDEGNTKEYKGIYKFTDDGADLIYISNASEKKGKIKQLGNKIVKERMPNQIYKFDDNYKTNKQEDGKSIEFIDIVKGEGENKGEKWTFIDDTIASEDSLVKSFAWMKDMNRENLYGEASTADGEQDDSLILGDDRKEIEGGWKTKIEKEKEDKKKENHNEKAREKEKTLEEKKTEKILVKYKLWDDIQEIAEIQNKIAKEDENVKIERLEKENKELEKDKEGLEKNIKRKRIALGKAEYNTNTVLKNGISGEIAELNKELGTIKEEIKVNKEEIEKLERKNAEEKLLMSKKKTKSEYRDGGYKNTYGSFRSYKNNLKVLPILQTELVNKIEKKVAEVTEASKSNEIEVTTRDKFLKELAILKPILESQKIFRDIGKTGSKYTRNDADRIVKRGDDEDISYTMDKFGRLIKNELDTNTNETTQTVIELDEK